MGLFNTYIRKKWGKRELDKSELEKVLQIGLHGVPEIKKEEKKKYLGCFRERVLKVLTKKQIVEPGTYKEILEAIKDPRAQRLIITNDVKISEAMEYINMAKNQNVEFTMVDGDNFTGDIGLVVVSDKAVDEENIYI